MTLSINDKVVVVGNKIKTAIKLSSLAVGDPVMVVPSKGQNIAVGAGSLVVGDEVTLIPDGRGKFIALKSGIIYTPGTCILKWSASFATYGGLWVDQNNDIWVIDSTRTITKYRPNGTTVFSFTDTTHLASSAADLCTDSAGNIYVIGQNNLGYGQVAKYDSGGNFLSLLNEAGSLYYWQHRIAIDSNNNIWLPEHNGGVYTTGKYTTSPSWGLSRSISGLGPVTGLDIKGSTYLHALLGSSGVVKINVSTGATTVWSYTTGFNSPYGLAVDGDLGYVYITDYVNNTITILNPDGTLKATWTGYTFGGTTYAFNGTLDCGMDDSHHLYVADRGSGQVLKIQGLTS